MKSFKPKTLVKQYFWSIGSREEAYAMYEGIIIEDIEDFVIGNVQNLHKKDGVFFQKTFPKNKIFIFDPYF